MYLWIRETKKKKVFPFLNDILDIFQAALPSTLKRNWVVWKVLKK